MAAKKAKRGSKKKAMTKKKSSRKKSTSKKKSSRKKSPAKKGTTKKAAAKKSATKKAAAKKSTTKKAAAKKSTTKKASSKKKRSAGAAKAKRKTSPSQSTSQSPRKKGKRAAKSRAGASDGAATKTPKLARSKKSRRGAGSTPLEVEAPGVESTQQRGSGEKASAQQSLFAEDGVTPAPGVGNKVPSFSLEDQNGTTVSSEELSGKRYVLYFYPKDDTAGCTKEACDFRDQLQAFETAGVRVIGVSPDSRKSHARFSEKYDLNFTLLSDPDKQLAQQLGVWQLKKNYGREYMGIVRSTFLVNENGYVERSWRKVKVAGHVPAVLGAAVQRPS